LFVDGIEKKGKDILWKSGFVALAFYFIYGFCLFEMTAVSIAGRDAGL